MSHCSKTNNDNSSGIDSKEYETISYTVVCDDLCDIIKHKNIPLDSKRAVKTEMTKQEQLPDSEKISAHSKMVDIPRKVISGMMKEAQEEDSNISKTIHYVKSSKKPTLAQIKKIKSRPVHRYLHQFDQLVVCQ